MAASRLEEGSVGGGKEAAFTRGWGGWAPSRPMTRTQPPLAGWHGAQGPLLAGAGRVTLVRRRATGAHDHAGDTRPEKALTSIISCTRLLWRRAVPVAVLGLALPAMSRAAHNVLVG